MYFLDDLSKLDIGCQLITAFGNMTGDKSTFRLKLENVLNPVEILFLQRGGGGQQQTSRCKNWNC